MDEGTEDFMVEITNVPTGVGTGLPKTSTISIVDNDGKLMTSVHNVLYILSWKCKYTFFTRYHTTVI